VLQLSPDAMVMPGFVDAHVHPMISGIIHFQCDIARCNDFQEATQLLLQFSKTLKETEWLVGAGWRNEWFPNVREKKRKKEEVNHLSICNDYRVQLLQFLIQSSTIGRVYWWLSMDTSMLIISFFSNLFLSFLSHFFFHFFQCCCKFQSDCVM
jgi:hypothetical protein